MEKFKITIDDKTIEVMEGTTVLTAAKNAGIHIPTLCYLHLDKVGMVNQVASCRVCVVEVEGKKNLVPACVAPVEKNMVVKTHTIRVLQARKTIIKLILSDHPKDCLVCPKSGECELQKLAEDMGIREVVYEGEESTYRKDFSESMIRDMNKCIMCRRCETMCNQVQTVGVLSGVNRGFNAVVATPFEINIEDSVCTYCGQCVSVCPVGALTEKDHTWKVIEALADPDKVVVVQTAPAVRVALGEEFGYPVGTSVTGKMTAALRRLGFNYVFDTDFAADLTIMEEAAELLDRLTRHLNGDKTARLPILTSCCPAWVKFFEHQFPDLLDVPSTAKSPMQMFGAIAKSYFAEKLGVPKEKLVVVSVMPCLAKKYEAHREEFIHDGHPDIDYSISTRELARLIKQCNIEFKDLPDEDFDKPLGESTGAGVIFGTTGGVIEAALRTAAEWYTNKPLEEVEFEQVRGMQGLRQAMVKLGDLELSIGIAHGLGNARKLLEEIREGKSHFHAIEIMACPGGCIGGGGQPYHHGDMKILKKRSDAIYAEDESKTIRKSHENPYIQELYEKYFDKPLSEKAHKLLHTRYFRRKTY